jgi:hypothetical protein
MHRRVSTAAVVIVGLMVGLAVSGTASAVPVGPSGAGPSVPCGRTAARADTTMVWCSAVELDNTSAWRGHHLGGHTQVPTTPSGYGETSAVRAVATRDQGDGRSRPTVVAVLADR